MAVFESSTNRIISRIVYDGPALAGKTTNMTRLCAQLTPRRRSEILTTETTADRTLFLDWLQVEAGVIAGYRTRCQLISVPGQAVLARRRRLLLELADAIVFVINSTAKGVDDADTMLRATLRFASGMEDPVPVVLQANKRDLPDVLSIAQISALTCIPPELIVAANAETGEGVRETAALAMRVAAERLQRRVLACGVAGMSNDVMTGERLMQAMLDLEASSPMTPAQIVMGNAALKGDLRLGENHSPAVPGDTLGVAADGAEPGVAVEPPPLPDASVPSGWIWPLATGRDLIRSMPLESLRGVVARRDDARMPRVTSAPFPGGVVLQVGEWRLETTAEPCSTDLDAARHALLLEARRCVAQARETPAEVVLTLQCDAGRGYWLWRIVRASGMEGAH